MSIKLKELSDQVMVVTGASSGIGLATAKAAAAGGASVVLASRNATVLLEVEQEINAAGGQAIHVVADVSDRRQVEKIADAAIARFGRIDTWVNNAGLGTFGRIEEISEEDHRRLFDTNFWGIVHGSLVALPFLKQNGGALINLGSVVSDAAVPLQGMYSASKHAIKGFTDALRMELEAEDAPVSVTLIKPSAINTPFVEHAKNYMDKEAKLPPPVYAVEEVANAILHAASEPARDIYIGGGGRAMSVINRMVPQAFDWVGSKILTKQQTTDEAVRQPQLDSLHQNGLDGRTSGDHPGYVMKKSYYTRASLHPRWTGAVLATLLVVTAALLLGGNRSPDVDCDS